MPAMLATREGRVDPSVARKHLGEFEFRVCAPSGNKLSRRSARPWSASSADARTSTHPPPAVPILSLLLTLAIALSAALATWAEHRGVRRMVYVFKPLTTVLILALAATAPGAVSERYRAHIKDFDQKLDARVRVHETLHEEREHRGGQGGDDAESETAGLNRKACMRWVSKLNARPHIAGFKSVWTSRS